QHRPGQVDGALRLQLKGRVGEQREAVHGFAQTDRGLVLHRLFGEVVHQLPADDPGEPRDVVDPLFGVERGDLAAEGVQAFDDLGAQGPEAGVVRGVQPHRAPAQDGDVVHGWSHQRSPHAIIVHTPPSAPPAAALNVPLRILCPAEVCTGQRHRIRRSGTERVSRPGVIIPSEAPAGRLEPGGSAGIRRAFSLLRLGKSILDSPCSRSYRGGDVGPRGRCDGGWKMATTRVANAQPAGSLLTAAQMERYSRQIILEEMGIEGQARLLRSKVLIVGAGGLGSPTALYLAAAGVGTIGIVDGDQVDVTNLHRQILHGTPDLGRPKTESAQRTLGVLNPDVTVVPHQTVLTSANALEIIGAYDVVINGSDNFPTRYLVNDACVLLGKPLVDASILKWEGQATTFVPGHGCYRCLFPTP